MSLRDWLQARAGPASFLREGFGVCKTIRLIACPLEVVRKCQHLVRRLCPLRVALPSRSSWRHSSLTPLLQPQQTATANANAPMAVPHLILSLPSSSSTSHRRPTISSPAGMVQRGTSPRQQQRPPTHAATLSSFLPSSPLSFHLFFTLRSHLTCDFFCLPVESFST